MKRSNGNLWKFDAGDEQALSNARVALALMQCVRCSSTPFPESDWGDLGAALAPVALKHPRAFKGALQTYSRDQIAAGKEPCLGPDDSFSQTCSRKVMLGLGEGVARDLPWFHGLIERMRVSLDMFLARNTSVGERNLATLARLTGLSPAETNLLRLAAACFHGSIGRSMFIYIDSISRVTRTLMSLFDFSHLDVGRLLHGQSPITRYGLIETSITRRSKLDLEDLLHLSATGARLLSIPYEDEQSMARSVLTPMTPCGAALLAWPHLDRQRGLLKAALTGALDNAECGVNMLLYGTPGTGKTEFVRQLVAEIGAHAFAISEIDDHGSEANRPERLANLQLTQVFVRHAGRSVIVLDEAEDIFQSDYNEPALGRSQTHAEGKAWINALLEKNPVPVIWISNRISQLDPAYLRRFACCLEFPVTPYALRRTIAQQRLGLLGCSEATIDFASATPEVTPAHLDIAARFAGMGSRAGPGCDAAVRFVLESHLKAGGTEERALAPPHATRFDLRYLNIGGNARPEIILEALQRRGQAAPPAHGTAMLFSGLPGTGKTQLAAEMATRLGLRLVVKTASDINSMWYGGSEGNVARMFRECDPATELLFLDEAEVLLGARSAGTHRADRAVTAEFLRWLELFQGIFVCATNHAEHFDAALMRRFTFRLEFRPLHSSQRMELYAELAQGWHVGAGPAALQVDDATRQQIERIEGLTPGDYANAARRIRALDLPASAWIDELKAEHRSKPGIHSQPIGFV